MQEGVKTASVEEGTFAYWKTLTAIEAGKEEGTRCGGCSVGSKAGARLVLEGAEKLGVRSIKIQDLFRLQ